MLDSIAKDLLMGLSYKVPKPNLKVIKIIMFPTLQIDNIDTYQYPTLQIILIDLKKTVYRIQGIIQFNAHKSLNFHQSMCQLHVQRSADDCQYCS
jgi:hypothetical protein